MLYSLIGVTALWILFLQRWDTHRASKQSAAAVPIFFAFGLLSVPLALFLYRVAPYFILVFPTATVNDFFLEMLIVGPIEEGAKFLIFAVTAGMLKSIHEPRDAMIQAASVALAFASVENYLYATWYGPQVLVFRSVLSVSGHMAYAGIWGYYYSLVYFSLPVDGTAKDAISRISRTALHDRRRGGAVVATKELSRAYRLPAQPTDYRPILLSLLVAALVHGTYNFCATLGLPLLSILIDGATAILGMAFLSRLAAHSPYTPYRLSEYRTAISTLRRSLRHHPDDFLLNRRIAIYYIYAGFEDRRGYEHALAHLKRCLRTRPGNIFIHFYRGVCTLLLGRLDQARRLIAENSRKMKPESRARVTRNVKRIVRDKTARAEIVGIVEEAAALHSGLTYDNRIGTRTPRPDVRRNSI